MLSVAVSMLFACMSLDGQVVPETGVVTGQVVRADNGEGLSRATVAVHRVDGSGPPILATTSADGEFSLSGLADGVYRVRASKAGYTSGTVPAVAATGGTLVAIQGRKVSRVRLVLHEAAAVVGTVRDETGAGVAGAAVTVLRVLERGGPVLVEETFLVSTTTLSGEYRLHGVPPGRYVVFVTRSALARDLPNFRVLTEADVERALRGQSRESVSPKMSVEPSFGYGGTFWPGSPDLASAALIDVLAGAEVSGVDVQLVPTVVADLRIRVMHNGVPFSGATIRIRPSRETSALAAFQFAPGARFGPQRSGSSGQVEFAGLASGSYEVTVVAEEGDQRARLFGESSVILDAGGGDVILHLTELGDVRGSVERETPPVGDTDIQVDVRLIATNPLPGQDVRTVAAQDGTFLLPGVMPGSYRVIAQATGEAARVWHQASPTFIQVTTAGVTGLRLQLTTKVTTLAGTLAGALGIPPFHYVVLAFPADEDTWEGPGALGYQTRPNADGTFELRGVEPGRYFVVVLDEEVPTPKDLRLWRDAAPHALAVDLTSGGTNHVVLRVSSRQ